jgi:hypothetical protein
LFKKLRPKYSFIPCGFEDDDELYNNGIFVFNISKMIKCLNQDPEGYNLTTILVDHSLNTFSCINESHVDSVDINKPVILAEISPGQYTLIDGHHRVHKAQRAGVKNLNAYKLDHTQHIRFLTELRGYTAYIEYWNSKIKQANSREGGIYDNR